MQKRYIDNGDGNIQIMHNYGFFSCCSVILDSIIDYFNNKQLVPNGINTKNVFGWYKKWRGNSLIDDDITFDFFQKYDSINISIYYSKPVYFNEFTQYVDYKSIDYRQLTPFIRKYFSPNQEILEIVDDMETKYCLYDYSNICVLYYRGNDKATEIKLGSYDGYIERARELLEKNPKLLFLVQSDETEFIDLMKTTFPKKTIIFNDEIRHMNKTINTVDKIDVKNNYKFAKYYFAITIIMSKCKHIICNTGNCSLWIFLYRCNADNIHQQIEDRWL